MKGIKSGRATNDYFYYSFTYLQHATTTPSWLAAIWRTGERARCPCEESACSRLGRSGPPQRRCPIWPRSSRGIYKTFFTFFTFSSGCEFVSSFSNDNKNVFISGLSFWVTMTSCQQICKENETRSNLEISSDPAWNQNKTRHLVGTCGYFTIAKPRYRLLARDEAREMNWRRQETQEKSRTARNCTPPETTLHTNNLILDHDRTLCDSLFKMAWNHMKGCFQKRLNPTLLCLHQNITLPVTSQTTRNPH